MNVKTFVINTTVGKKYGLQYLDGGVVPSGKPRFKTEKGAINYATKKGYIVKKGGK